MLVTGGAGFIGSHLVDALLKEGAEKVSVVDNFSLGKEKNLDQAFGTSKSSLTVYREDAGNMNAMSSVMEAERPDVVFNLATRPLLYSFINPGDACRINLDIAITLAELQRRSAFGKLIHLSSSEVYGSAVQVPMDETHPLLAETSYAAGKAAADLLLTSYVNMFDQDIVIGRPFNNYGPRQNEASFAALLPLTVHRIRQNEPPVIQGDGLQTRDFMFVYDTVKAVMNMASLNLQKGSLLNLGSGQETSIKKIIHLICQYLGYEGDIIYEPERAADVRRHCADIKLASSLLGPLSGVPLEQGIETTVQWYLDHE